MTRNYLEWLTNMPWGVYSKACWIFLVWNRKRHAMTCLLQLSTPAVPWIRALGSPSHTSDDSVGMFGAAGHLRLEEGPRDLGLSASKMRWTSVVPSALLLSCTC